MTPVEYIVANYGWDENPTNNDLPPTEEEEPYWSSIFAEWYLDAPHIDSAPQCPAYDLTWPGKVRYCPFDQGHSGRHGVRLDCGLVVRMNY